MRGNKTPTGLDTPEANYGLYGEDLIDFIESEYCKKTPVPETVKAAESETQNHAFIGKLASVNANVAPIYDNHGFHNGYIEA
jgi:hypothetical protein